MHKVVERVRVLEESLEAVVRDAFTEEAIPDLSNAEIAELLVTCGRMQRRLEGLQVESTVVVVERSAPMYDDRITLAYGCATPVDLLRMLTLCDAHAARRTVRAARWMRRERSVTEGCFLPSKYPMLRSAMVAGDIGIAGLVAGSGRWSSPGRASSTQNCTRPTANWARSPAASTLTSIRMRMRRAPARFRRRRRSGCCRRR